MAEGNNCFFEGSLLQQVLGDNFDTSDFTIEDFVLKRNELYKNLYDVYNNQEGGKEVIETAMQNMLLDGLDTVKEGEMLSVLERKIKDISSFLTKMSTIVSLDINNFNYYLYDYFDINRKGNGSSDFMPLVQQEEAIYDQVAMITSNSSDLFSKAIDNAYNVVINDYKAKYAKSYRAKSFKNVIRLNAAAGTGKTKLVAGTTLKIAEQIMGDAKHNKIIATAANDTMARDIYDELKNVVGANVVNENLSIDAIVKKIQDGDLSFLKDVKVLMIDEASLLQAGTFSNNIDFTDEEYLFNVIYDAIQKSGYDVKIVLLGDNKQLSFYNNGEQKIGKGLSTTTEDNMMISSDPLSIVGMMESSELTDSFRTSSILLQNVFGQLRNYDKGGKGFVMDERPLVGKYARSKEGGKRLLGFRNTEGKAKTKEKVTTNDYVADFDAALREVVSAEGESFSVIDSIEEQVKNQKKGNFEVIYAANLGSINEDMFLDQLAKVSEVGKRFVDLVRDRNNKFKFKYYGDEIVSAQGQEADYVFMNFTNSDLGDIRNDRVNNMGFKIAKPSYRNAMAVMYMLASRARLYTHSINNHNDANINTSFDKDLYNVLSENDIVEKANVARNVYGNVYAQIKENLKDVEGNESVINWGETKVSASTEEEKKINKQTKEIKVAVHVYNDLDSETRDFSVLEEVIRPYENLSDDKINEEVKYTISKIQNSNDVDERRILVKKITLLEQVLNIRNFLKKNKMYVEDDNFQLILDSPEVKATLEDMYKNDSILNTYSRAIEKLDTSDLKYEEKRNEYIEKIHKRKAALVAIVMEQYGYVYAYPQYDKEFDEKKYREDIDVMKSLGFNDADITTLSQEEKYKALNITESTANYSHDLIVKKEDGKYHVYVIGSKNIQLGFSRKALLLHTYSDEWKGETAKILFDRVEKDMQDNNTDIVKLQNINLKEITSHITPGPIKSGNRMTLKSWLDKNVEGDLLTFGKGKKIFFSKKIYTYSGDVPSLKGKQFLMYSQSKDIDLSSSEIQSWAKYALSSDGNSGNFKGLFVDSNGNRYKIGMMMLDNNRKSLQELYNQASEENFSSMEATRLFTLMNGFLVMPNMVSFFSNLYLALDSSSLKSNNTLRKKLEYASSLDESVNKLFGSDPALRKLGQEDFVKAVQELPDAEKDLLVEFLDTIFNVKVNDSGIHGEYTGGLRDTDKGKRPSRRKGEIFTLLEGTNIDGEEFKPELTVKLEKILLHIRTMNLNNSGSGDIVLEKLDYLLGRTKYFNKGVKVRFIAESKGAVTGEFLVDNHGEGVISESNLEELTINVSDIGEPRLVLDVNKINDVFLRNDMNKVAVDLEQKPEVNDKNINDEVEPDIDEVVEDGEFESEEIIDSSEEIKQPVTVKADTDISLKTTDELIDRRFEKLFKLRSKKIENADDKLKELISLLNKYQGYDVNDIPTNDVARMEYLNTLLLTGKSLDENELNKVVEETKAGNGKLLKVCK